MSTPRGSGTSGVGGEGCSWEVSAAAGPPGSVLLSLYRDGVHLPPHFSRLLPACVSRGSGWGVAGGLLDGVPHVRPLPGLLLNGAPLLPTYRCLESREGGGSEWGTPLLQPHNHPPAPPPPPKAAHQQVDAAGNAQTDSAQNSGEQEASRDGQPVGTGGVKGGVFRGCPPSPNPTPHSRCMQNSTDVVIPGERSEHLQHGRHVPLPAVG